MLRKIVQILISITITAIFYSCTFQKTNVIEPYCPEPKIECKPTKYTGIARDTSADVARIQGWHYKIEPVQLINSKGNEWNLVFNGDTPYLTVSDGNKNRLMHSKLINFRRILPQKFINPEDNSHIGFPAFSNNLNLVSTSADYSQVKQNEFLNPGDRILVPLEESIGISRIKFAEIKGTNIQTNKQIINAAKLKDWYSHPTIGFDGKIVFFASDRGGSLGGTDLWYVIEQNGQYSEPINCGANVNSQCEEITPFISTDGKYLYFASNGGETLGGYDIFRSQINFNASKNEVAFGVRDNLRAPINTVYNELSPTCLYDCDSLFYYSSNQYSNSKASDLGGYDIFVRYKVFIKEEIKKKEIAEPLLSVDKKETVQIETPKNWFYRMEGKVFEKSTNKPIAGADVITRETSSDITNNVKTNQDGYYTVQMIKNEEYLVTAQYSTLFPDNSKIFIGLNDTTNRIVQDFYLEEKYTLRVNFPTDVYDNPYRFVLDSNGNETNITWQEEIQSLANNIMLMRDKIIKVVLVGHTDDVGTVEYNQKLGERRVNFVISELIKKGVPRELLEGRSAGELEPLERAADEKMETYRKRLRRVVLERILK